MTLLADFRTYGGRVELSPREQARVLARVRADLKLPTCQGGEVRAELTGRFTCNARQTAYLVYNCLASAAEPLREEYGRLVIYEQGKLLASLKNVGDEVRLLPDVNGDGVNELLFATAFGPHMGEFSENASVVNVRNGRLRTFIDLNEALIDYCSSGFPDATSVAWRIRAQQAGRPIFTLDRYKAPCVQGEAASYKFQYSKRVLADTP